MTDDQLRLDARDCNTDTRDDARTRLCPISAMREKGDLLKEEDAGYCMAGLCMLWRWTETATRTVIIAVSGVGHD